MVGQLGLAQPRNAQILFSVQVGVILRKMGGELLRHGGICAVILDVCLFDVYAKDTAADGFADGERRQLSGDAQHTALQPQRRKVGEKGVDGELLRHAGGIGVAVPLVIAVGGEGDALIKISGRHLREHSAIFGELCDVVALFVVFFSGQGDKFPCVIEVVGAVPLVFQSEAAGKARLQTGERLRRQTADDQRLMQRRRNLCHCPHRPGEIAGASGKGEVRCAVLSVESADQIEIVQPGNAGVRRTPPRQIVGEAVFAAHKLGLFQSVLHPRTVGKGEFVKTQHPSTSRIVCRRLSRICGMG